MSPAQSTRNVRRRSHVRGRWLVALGVAILLLPIMLTLIHDAELDRVARRYSQAAQSTQPRELLAHKLAEAAAYNERLAQSGHHALPPSPEAPGMAEYRSVLDLPHTGGAIARVIVPSIDVDLPVFHTTRTDVLMHGAGHMFGSDLPVGGLGRTAVISAHTGMVNATMFDNLPRVAIGDEVLIQVMGETHRYRVRGKKVVRPDNVDGITYEPDQDKIVLVTCTPYGLNTDRLLVEAVRVADGEPGPLPADHWRPRLSWWMMVDLLLILLVLANEIRAERRRRRRERERVGSGPGTTMDTQLDELAG